MFGPRVLQQGGFAGALVVAALTLVVAGGFMAVALTDHSAHHGLSAAERQRAVAAYGRLPLSFAVNRGQGDPQARFLAQGAGYGLFFTSRGPVLALKHSKSSPVEDFVRMQMLDGSAHPGVEGVGRLPGTVSYFIGSDRSRWLAGVPIYSHVRYRSVWPGVDVDFYGNSTALDYDLHVAPEADPAKIALAFDGARSIRLTPSGDLLLGLSQGDLLQRRPIVYQQLGSHRRLVTAGYVVRDGREVHLRLGAYDHSRPLIVDPGLVYSSYLGGVNADYGAGIAVNSSGDAYVTGYTASSNFPTTMGAAQTSLGTGTADAFITELNATGSAIAYSTYLGGSNVTYGTGIAVDSAGDAYVTGYTTSQDFPTTAGAAQTSYGTSTEDAFVTELNATGSAIIYSTYLGESNETGGTGIAVDSTGDAYVVGTTNSGAFPTTAGAYQTTFPDDSSCAPGPCPVAFVSKLDSSGALSYSTYLGDEAFGQGIAIDSSGDAYVTGIAFQGDFPTTTGAYQTNALSTAVAFVTKLNPSGAALSYSTFLGGSGSNQGDGIAVNSSGDAYIIGSTSASNFPTTTGAYQTTCSTCSSGTDAFVTELNATATVLTYSTYLGGNSSTYGEGIAVDSAGRAYVTGYTGSTDFPTTAGAYQTSLAGEYDAFVTELNATATALTYSTYLGGSGSFLGGYGRGIAVDSAGGAYTTGGTESADFPTTSGAYQTSFAGNTDAFVAKITHTVVKALCTGDNGTITLSPGLTSTPAVQTMKIKGTLTGCSGDTFTGTRYTATLTTAGAVSCSILKAAGEPESGSVKYRWAPKTKASIGTLSLPLTEADGVALSGAVITGPYSPLTLSGTANETYTGGATCGEKVGKKAAPVVKKGTFSGPAVDFE